MACVGYHPLPSDGSPIRPARPFLLVKDKALARYRKIDPRMWGDEKFRALSKPKPNAQTLWQYLLTGPHTNGCPGLYNVGPMALAESLGWELKDFMKVFREVLDKGMVKADFKTHVILIPKALKYDSPENPNVLKKWAKDFDEIPECELKNEYYHIIKDFIKDFGELFNEVFQKDFGKSITIPLPLPEPIKEILSGKPDLIPSEEIISYLNQVTRKHFSIRAETHQKHIKARWNEGKREEDFKKVVDIKFAKWGSDPKMIDYLRPETLFGTKMDSYLNEDMPQSPYKDFKIIGGKEDGAKNREVPHMESSLKSLMSEPSDGDSK